MRYIATAVAFCFLLAPLQAKTVNRTHVSKVKKHKVKGRRAARRSAAKVHRVS